MLVEELVEMGGPRPTKPEKMAPICGCGGTCDGDCKCGGTCGGDCGCKDLSSPQETQTTPTALENNIKNVENASKKYITNENILKFAIALAIGAAAYVMIKD